MSKRSTPSRLARTRRVERVLFAWVLLCIALGYAALLMVRLMHAPRLHLYDAYPLLFLAAALLLLHGVMGATRSQADPLFLPPVMLLAGIGMLIQLRLQSLDPARPLAPENWPLPLGVVSLLVAFLALRRGRYKLLRKMGPPAYLLTLGALAAVAVYGHRFRGALFLPGNINPTEVVKLLIPVYAAAALSSHRRTLEKTRNGLPMLPPGLAARFLVLWLVPLLLLLYVRDLGLFILINATVLVMVFALTRRWSYLVAGALLTVGLVAVLCLVASHTLPRITAWLHPFRDPTGNAWQQLQSLSAMYTGGAFGSGMGAGAPRFVPIAASDFVYAGLAEELGFAGCFLVVGLYLFVFARGYRLAACTRDDFSRTLAAGLITVLALQALLNIGGVTKALPLTGITLPFISLGGSSLVTSFMLIGVLCAISEAQPASGAASRKRSARNRTPRRKN